MKSHPVHVWLNRAAWCALAGFPLVLGMLLVLRPGQALAAGAPTPPIPGASGRSLRTPMATNLASGHLPGSFFATQS